MADLWVALRLEKKERSPPDSNVVASMACAVTSWRKGGAPEGLAQRPYPQERPLGVLVLLYPHLVTISARGFENRARVNAPAELNSCQISTVSMHEGDVLCLSP